MRVVVRVARGPDAGPVQFRACHGLATGGSAGSGSGDCAKGGKGQREGREREDDERVVRGQRGVAGDGRRADGILWSVQYVPICRHVLSIPSAPSPPRNSACLPTYLPTFIPHGIVTSIPSYAR